MAERPLLILPLPGAPGERAKKNGRGGHPHVPTRARQAERLSPRFVALQQSLEARRIRVQTEAAGLAPEEVIVLEVAASVEGFIGAVRAIEGLEWLGEVAVEEIPPDDEFFIEDKRGRKTDKHLRGRLFLVFTNQHALKQILSLWEDWKTGEAPARGLGKWSDVFALLRDVRPWGLRDRLLETGVLDDWKERIEHAEEVVPCEIELWFRSDPRKRRAARDRVVELVRQLGGELQHEVAIEDIAYHAVAIRLPIVTVKPLVERIADDATLVQCEQVQFFRASGQMAGILTEEDARSPDTMVETPGIPTPRPPVVALFDGMPLQNHQRLVGKLVIDDPDDHEAKYQVAERQHGTAMASLILHGELDAGTQPLGPSLYVRPILQPDPRDWRSTRREIVSEDTLVVDLLHRAVRRLYEDEGVQPPVAPQVSIINLSIGILDRPFDASLSPLAKLLDWLAWKYRVLFIVSAGNRSQAIELAVPTAQLQGLTARDFQTEMIRAIAADVRHRRLLSPAEAINALTVGALHNDGSIAQQPLPGTRFPFVGKELPSVINAQGMGYRRGIKPDALLPGGRVLLRQSFQPSPNIKMDVTNHSRPPGQRVAAPGTTPGDTASSVHIRGTSGATALCSRTAAELYEVLEALRADPGGALIDQVPRSVWLKALLIHGAQWGAAGTTLEQVLRTPANGRQFKEYITRLLGYGAIDASRVRECTQHRVTALGGGSLRRDQAHIHLFPLPPSLSGRTGWRRLTITLAWLTPVSPLHQAWRCADLWFEPPTTPLHLDRQQADWRAVQRGTVQHEILEGTKAAAYVDGTDLRIRVSCRADAGALEASVPYALASTIEIAPELGIDIYTEIKVGVDRIRAPVPVTPN